MTSIQNLHRNTKDSTVKEILRKKEKRCNYNPSRPPTLLKTSVIKTA